MEQKAQNSMEAIIRKEQRIKQNRIDWTRMKWNGMKKNRIEDRTEQKKQKRVK